MSSPTTTEISNQREPEHDEASGGAMWVDAAGLFLLLLMVAWALASLSLTEKGEPEPLLWLVAGVTIAIGAGRALGSAARWLPPALVVLGGLALAAMDPEKLLSSRPLSEPLGYVNANASFVAQVSVAGAILAAATRLWPIRAIGVLVAAGFAVVPFIERSYAAGVLLLGLYAACGLGYVVWRGRGAILVCGILVLSAVSMTTIMAARYHPARRDPITQLVKETLTDKRLILWHDAWVLMREEPVTGIGPRRFQILGQRAQADRDDRWAHNSFLQQGAEQGVIGLVLLVLVFVWGFASLFIRAGGTAVGALGAVGLATLGIHASVDYVLHFAAVPVAAAFLFGGASVGARTEEP